MERVHKRGRPPPHVSVPQPRLLLWVLLIVVWRWLISMAAGCGAAHCSPEPSLSVVFASLCSSEKPQEGCLRDVLAAAGSPRSHRLPCCAARTGLCSVICCVRIQAKPLQVAGDVTYLNNLLLLFGEGEKGGLFPS